MINFPGQNSVFLCFFLFFFSVCSKVKLHILIHDGLRFQTVCPKGKFILAIAERETLVDWHQFLHKIYIYNFLLHLG